VIVPITKTRVPDRLNSGWPVSGRWAQQGACRAPGVDPDLFFPVGVRGPALLQITAAKAVCARCPVTADCLAAAMRSPEAAGIWGGTTPEERYAQRAGLQRPAGQQPQATQ
jgi:WhiB family redox-sensing transcriptional regulator